MTKNKYRKWKKTAENKLFMSHTEKIMGKLSLEIHNSLEQLVKGNLKLLLSQDPGL